MAWGAAKHVLKSAPPVQMVRQLSHNLDLASVAASQVWAGDYGLALNTMLQLPYEGALGAASIVTGPIEAAIEVPDMVRTAIDAADPEVKGAAAVQALQDIATVGLTVVAVGQAVKGPGSIVKGAADSKSVKTFQHTFTRHGEGAKTIRSLTDRARSTGTPQGQWLDNQAAADLLQSHRAELGGAASIRIPEGLGRVIMPDGSRASTTRATLVPGPNGFVTAYPIP